MCCVNRRLVGLVIVDKTHISHSIQWTDMVLEMVSEHIGTGTIRLGLSTHSTRANCGATGTSPGATYGDLRKLETSKHHGVVHCV